MRSWSLFSSRRGISKKRRSPTRWTLNRPRLDLASDVMTRSYGRGPAPRPVPAWQPGPRLVESGSWAKAGKAAAASRASDRVVRMEQATVGGDVGSVRSTVIAKMGEDTVADKVTEVPAVRRTRGDRWLR